MPVGQVVIVGAGPAGAALAYLLARRGVPVALLERHPDFERTFRGDGLQPSGLDAFDQMGLGDRLRQLPQALIKTIDLYQAGRRRARLATASLGFIGCFIPQPAVLAMLAEESRKHPSFQLHMATAVRDLIWSRDRVVGVQPMARTGLVSSQRTWSSAPMADIRRSASGELSPSYRRRSTLTS
jgi:2-polyprenyl-6-methoxyphenol hydroxylase-like FAD-dependent oxidoreductase